MLSAGLQAALMGWPVTNEIAKAARVQPISMDGLTHEIIGNMMHVAVVGAVHLVALSCLAFRKAPRMAMAAPAPAAEGRSGSRKSPRRFF